MNYRHAYHAGNFADVVKHATLIALLNALSKKETPFCYMDTHAGAGFYDLSSDFALKSKEYENGIQKIIHQNNPPPLIKQYLNCIHQINETPSSSLKFYPGSPMIAHSLLRKNDRIIACELHPQEYQALKKMFVNDKQVAVHKRDGLIALNALLPPAENRGLVLIDPPYENPNEYQQIIQALTTALKRFENGIYAVWYPLKEKIHIEKWQHQLKNEIKKPILLIELTIYPDLPKHLNGCGLLVINPPWQFDQTMQTILPWLWNALTINQQGAYQLISLGRIDNSLAGY